MGSPGAFYEFVLSRNEEALEAFYAAGRLLPVLGSDKFGGWVGQKVPPLSAEHPRYERVKVRPSILQVMQAVAAAVQVKVATLKTSRREVNEARKVAMYLVKRLCDLTLPETAGKFGVASYGAVGWACAQVRAKLKTDPQFKKRVEAVEILFSQPKICSLDDINVE